MWVSKVWVVGLMLLLITATVLEIGIGCSTNLRSLTTRTARIPNFYNSEQIVQQQTRKGGEVFHTRWAP